MTTFTLRHATPADGAACAAIYRPSVEGSAISFEAAAPDGAAMGTRILDGHRYIPWIVATRADAVVGYAGASPFRSRAAYAWTAEVFVYVDATVRRQRLATTLYRALLNDLSERGFLTAVAVTTVPNAVSEALHVAMGFARAGTLANAGFKNDQSWGVAFWSLALGPIPSTTPAPPRLGLP